jgi:hypothetical protein
MKRILVFLTLLILVQAACITSAGPNTTQTAQSATDIAASWTATPDYTGMITPQGADLYAGPAENYPVIGFVLDNVKIVGQAYGCTWFFVNVPANNLAGWIKADKISYSVACVDIAASTIPPTPVPTATFTLVPSSTFTLVPTATAINTLVPTRKPSSGGGGGGNTNSCPPQDNMTIGNRTGGYTSFKLVGPGIFYVTLAPDVNTSVKVCEGSYEVYLDSPACGLPAGTDLGNIPSGFDGWIYCP